MAAVKRCPQTFYYPHTSWKNQRYYPFNDTFLFLFYYSYHILIILIYVALSIFQHLLEEKCWWYFNSSYLTLNFQQSFSSVYTSGNWIDFNRTNALRGKSRLKRLPTNSKSMPFVGLNLHKLSLELTGHFLNYILSRRMKFEIDSKCGNFNRF